MLRLGSDPGSKGLMGRSGSRIGDRHRWPIAAEMRTKFEEADKASPISSDVVADVRRLAEELSKGGARTPKDIFALLCTVRKVDEATLRKILHI